MKSINVGGLLLMVTLLWSANAQAQQKNDPLGGVHIHTLDNGLKVYLDVYNKEPRIQTFVAVRTGSSNDPADATGLAHYLEHMLFKGTSKLASLDWKAEKPLLDEIARLYEAHREAKPEERAAIYAQIDSVSQLAAKYVSTNEYDRIISSLGASGTNAFTSYDQTVYINNIPSNQLEKWLKVEAERFNELTLRLFHTELEAVYEEFNIGQNNEGRQMIFQTFNKLFPNHPYGTQTTIGTSEHLKTPSMYKIDKYFNTYYIPNNMAIILSGDFDPKEALRLIEETFGSYKKGNVPTQKREELPAIKAPMKGEIYGPEQEYVSINYRLPAAGSDEALQASLIAHILQNGQAGLLDLDLVKAQKVGARTYAYSYQLNDLGVFMLRANARPNQKLEEVEALLLEQLDRIRTGDYDEWLLEACIRDLEYQQIKSFENTNARAFHILDAFISDRDWDAHNKQFERMRKFTKEDLAKFAKKHLRKDNYLTMYKRKGDPKNIVEVEKPSITPIPVNRESSSAFKSTLDKMQAKRLTPQFVDYDKILDSKKLKSGVQFDYIKNKENKTFSLSYILDLGSDHDKTLPLAINYLPFLGTDKYTPAELEKEFFRLGLSFNVNTRNDVSYVTLSGLDESFEEGVKLFEHILRHAKADKEALAKLVAQTKKERQDSKANKNNILYTAMASYATYGKSSPFFNALSNEELDALQAETLIDRIHNLIDYKHKVFYYGSQNMKSVSKVLNTYHKVAKKLKDYPSKKDFKQLDINENKVVFVHYDDMAQARVLMVAKGSEHFDLEQSIIARLYNDYFGSGLSSIVFQEIRESRALAYSAWANHGAPREKDQAHYMRAFIGTQADKLPQAIPAMLEIINELPIVEGQIEGARQAVLQRIESNRTRPVSAYFQARSNKKLGYTRDLNKDAYEFFQKDNIIESLKTYHKAHIANQKYVFLVLGDREKVDIDYLKSLGTFEEMELNTLFPY